MKLNWFTRKGIIYLPVSIIGWVILTIALMFSIYMFIAIDVKSHSVSDTLINFIFNFLVIGLCYTIIAWFTEARPKADALKS
jgi:hypothetical protein